MRRFGFAKLMLWLGLLFIYLPMIIMVIYSFNASKLVTVWGGWSLKWYFGLLDNKQLIGSVFRSLEIAFYTAIAAVALGTVAAFVLTRIPHFRGRTLFGGMVTAPPCHWAPLSSPTRLSGAMRPLTNLPISSSSWRISASSASAKAGRAANCRGACSTLNRMWFSASTGTW